jgi:hypothetical protein
MGATVITCTSCGVVLTRPLERLPAMPEPTQASPWDVGYLPTVREGAWAVDPDPVAWRGDVPTSTRGCFVVNPADAVGTMPSDDPTRNNGCCRHDGLDGPNLLCSGCRREVATLRDDCWSPVEVRFEPAAATAEAAPFGSGA